MKRAAGGGSDLRALEAISRIGHELRTPLTLIRGAATLLSQAYAELPPERVQEMLKLIEQGVESMGEQVEDLIAVCHLELGDLQLRLDTVELPRIVGPVVESLSRLEGRPIHVLGSHQGVRVRADRERAMQALRALVSNAVRFSTSDNPVEVSVARKPGQVRLDVLDRGPGVAPRNREVIFERFARLEQGGAGAGLGLYLARGLARTMGGDVGYEPRRGGGSCFWFTLLA